MKDLAMRESGREVFLTTDVLDVMMPFAVLADGQGKIVHAGRTLRKFETGRPFAGQNLLDVFGIQRPYNIESYQALLLQTGANLKLYLRSGRLSNLRGVATALPDGQGVIVNLGIGLRANTYIQELELTSADFSYAEGVTDLLYLIEMQRMLLDESADLIERLQAARKTADEAAGQDPLTSVYNRRGLQGYLRRLKQQSTDGQFAFVQVDLDYFKVVNDTHGHAIGDVVLKRVADIMRTAVRPDDVVARTGGDEFVIVLRSVGTVKALEQVCTRLIERISEPHRIMGKTCGVGASIGAVMFNPANGFDDHRLMELSDQFLYRAKEEGRGRVSIAPLNKLDAA